MATAESMKFLEDIFQLMVQECLTKGSKQENKVVEYLPPEKLKVLSKQLSPALLS